MFFQQSQPVRRIKFAPTTKRKNTRVLRIILGSENKKAGRVDWRRYFLISVHHYSRWEQLHKWSISGTTSQMTAGSGFTSKSQLAIPWRAASPREDVKLSLTAQWREDLRLRSPFFLLSKMLLWDCLHFIQAIPHFCKKNGGGRGIRTLGELPHTTFPMWRLRPLDHLSAMFRFDNIAPVFCFFKAVFKYFWIFSVLRLFFSSPDV